jgi:hypothetical protein
LQVSKSDLQKIIERIDLARNVYGGSDKPAVPQGWEIVTSSAPDPDKAEGFYARLYKKKSPAPGEPQYLVAFRGTHAGDRSDVAADIGIFFQQVPKQHSQGVAFIKKICSDYKINPTDIELIGHSSGGYVAKTVAMVLGANRVVGFNAPGPTAKMKEALAKEAHGDHTPPGRLVQIRAEEDVVGKWGFEEGIILEVKTKGDHHTLSTMRQSLEDMIKGSPSPEPEKPKPWSLRAIYNTFSHRVTHSGTIREKIRQIFGNDTPPRWSHIRPAGP